MVVFSLRVEEVIHDGTPSEGTFLAAVKVDEKVPHGPVAIVAHIILPLVEDIRIEDVLVKLSPHVRECQVVKAGAVATTHPLVVVLGRDTPKSD